MQFTSRTYIKNSVYTRNSFTDEVSEREINCKKKKERHSFFRLKLSKLIFEQNVVNVGRCRMWRYTERISLCWDGCFVRLMVVGRRNYEEFLRIFMWRVSSSLNYSFMKIYWILGVVGVLRNVMYCYFRPLTLPMVPYYIKNPSNCNIRSPKNPRQKSIKNVHFKSIKTINLKKYTFRWWLMIRSSILMGRNFYVWCIWYRNVPKEQVLPEKYNIMVWGNGIMMKRCAGMKISITLKKSSKLFPSFPIFFPHHHRSLFSSKERKSWCIRAHKYNQYFFIGEKRSYDRINCLLKTRFNIDNWTGIETHDYVYIYL